MTRNHIPNQLQRELFIETGYRCAICKCTEPLEIEHIEEYSETHEHDFQNMIVLCANCHSRKKSKSTDPRHINKLSLKKIKQNLIHLNARYSDLEKRVFEYLINQNHINENDWIEIPYDFYIFAIKIIQDGLFTCQRILSGVYIGGRASNDILKLSVTKNGSEFLKQIKINYAQ